jgi:ketosteroid isomerase-like protein
MDHDQKATVLVLPDPEALDPSFLRDFCTQWHTAWNAQDYERVAAMCTDDVEWRDPTMPEGTHGRPAIGKAMATLARACPDHQFEELEPAYMSPTQA